MIDKALAIGSMFDWITPIVAYIQKRRGKMVDYVIPENRIDELAQMEELVDVHFMQYVGDYIVFSIYKEDIETVISFFSNIKE